MFLNSNFAGTGHAKNGFDENINTHLPSIWSCLEIRKLSPAKQNKVSKSVAVTSLMKLTWSI